MNAPRLVNSLLVIVGVSLLLLAMPRPAPAQDQSQLLELLKARPRGMSVDTWREQRREAVRELGRLKERRAVPELLRIIDKERFDVILEIAIDALGNIGDRGAAEPLRKLLDDPSLDAYVRDAAASALKKLEGSAANGRRPAAPRAPTRSTPRAAHDAVRAVDTPRPGDAPRAEDRTATGEFARLPELKLEPLGVGTIAYSSRMDIVFGTGHLSWDGRSELTSAGFSLQGRYRRQLEAKSIGYTIDSAADLSFDVADPPTGSASWQLGHNVQLNPEVRFYPFTRDVPPLFGQVSAGLGYGLGASRVPATPDNRLGFAATLAIGGGPGYGRIYDVGPRLRLQRLERVLRRARLLKGEIDPNVGNSLLQTWYELRDTLGSYAQLGHTLRLLRRAKLLEADTLDPAVVYRLLRILDDPQLDDRPSGMLFRAGYGYARSLIKDADDITMAYAYATAALQRQRGTTRALGLEMRFFYNMWGSPDTYNVHLAAHYAWYLYNRAFDPLGAIQIDLSAGVNNQAGSAFDDGGQAFSLLAGASYARFFTRGTRVFAGVRGGLENGGGLLLITLEGRYGIAQGAFVQAR